MQRMWSSIEGSPYFMDFVKPAIPECVPALINFYFSYLVNNADPEKQGSYEESQAETFRRTYVGVKLDLVIAIAPQALLIRREIPQQDIPRSADCLHTGRHHWLAAVHSELLRYQDKVREIDFKDPPSRELLAKVRALPPHTVVLFHIPPETSQSEFGGWDLLAGVTERWPTYSAWPFCGQPQFATVPQVFNLWADPQERYDIFMNNFTESTWMGVVFEQEMKKIMATYVKYPPRKLQSYGYTGPITISAYERFQWIRDQLAKEGVSIPLPTGN